MDLEIWLKLYGPLGLGWPLFIWSVFRLVKVNEELRGIVENNTRALTLLAERVRVAHGE